MNYLRYLCGRPIGHVKRLICLLNKKAYKKNRNLRKCSRCVCQFFWFKISKANGCLKPRENILRTRLLTWYGWRTTRRMAGCLAYMSARSLCTRYGQPHTRRHLHCACFLVMLAQVPQIIHQAYLRTPGARSDVDIACEPVMYRIPVSLATSCSSRSGDNNNTNNNVLRSSSRRRVTWQASWQLIVVGYACARRDKQLQRWTSHFLFVEFYLISNMYFVFDWLQTDMQGKMLLAWHFLTVALMVWWHLITRHLIRWQFITDL